MMLSIIIPIYNEEKTIFELLHKVEKVDLVGVKKQIIIIDDGSEDKTFKEIEKFSNEKRKQNNELIVLRHTKNKGKGSAIRTGLEKVTGDITIIQDADLELDPEEYILLIKPILDCVAQVVYGSRILKKENVNRKEFSPFFYFGGTLLTKLTNLLYKTNITDEATCYKVFRTPIIKSLNLKCKRFEFCPEVTAKIAKKNIHICEVPISYYPRSAKEGKKVRFRDGFFAAWTLIKYKFID